MDPLYELLAPHLELDASTNGSPVIPTPSDTQTSSYLTRLSTLSLADLTTNEPASLLHSAQSHIRNLQALSKRSHKAVISSSAHLSNLSSLLPALRTEAHDLHNTLPKLEDAANTFAQKYDRNTENTVLDRRKRAMLLSRNVERASDILDLPALLSSTVSAAQASTSMTTSNTSTSYASALDLHAHIKRLSALYPQSQLVAGISGQAEAEIQNLTSILIASLQNPGLKLAAAMRTIGWLRRLTPELADDGRGSTKPTGLSTKALNFSSTAASSDGALGAIFLVCRLHTLHDTLEALDPLRELADQETTRRKQLVHSNRTNQGNSQTTSTSSQSERYLKRYIEIFREQSFSIVSMFKSIFPSGLPAAETNGEHLSKADDDALSPMPASLSSFAMHLVDMLSATLHEYMPNVTDRSSRESLLTQVLYCAGSLGRLGADFGMLIALLEEDLTAEAADAEDEITHDPEWMQVMVKHRVQAGRLEVLARGVGSGRKGSMDVQSLTATAA